MDENDVDGYIGKMEAVVKRKMDLYHNLFDRIQTFKSHLKEEEEIHSKVVQTKKLCS